MNDVVIAQWGSAGVVILGLIVAVKAIWAGLSRANSVNDRRSAEMAEACNKERKYLNERIDHLTQVHHDDYQLILVKIADVLRNNGDALLQNSKALDQMVQNERRRMATVTTRRVANPALIKKRKRSKTNANPI